MYPAVKSWLPSSNNCERDYYQPRCWCGGPPFRSPEPRKSQSTLKYSKWWAWQYFKLQVDSLPKHLQKFQTLSRIWCIWGWLHHQSSGWCLLTTQSCPPTISSLLALYIQCSARETSSLSAGVAQTNKTKQLTSVICNQPNFAGDMHPQFYSSYISCDSLCSASLWLLELPNQHKHTWRCMKPKQNMHSCLFLPRAMLVSNLLHVASE